MRQAPRKSLPWIAEGSAAENARAVLPRLAERLFAAGRKMVSADVTPKGLHRFRLEVKRFRYELELFQPCYGPALLRRLEQLKELQDHLGAVNDCETTLQLLRLRPYRKLAERRVLRKELKALSQTRTQAFISYWNETFDQPDRLRWWTTYLERYPR